MSQQSKVFRSCFYVPVDYQSNDKTDNGVQFYNLACTFNFKHNALHPYGGKADTASEDVVDVIAREWKEETGLEEMPFGYQGVSVNYQVYDGDKWEQSFLVSRLTDTSVSDLNHAILAGDGFEKHKLEPLVMRCTVASASASFEDIIIDIESFISAASDRPRFSGAMKAAFAFARLVPHG